MEKKNDIIPTWLIVIIVIILLVLFLASLGFFNPRDIPKVPKEYKDSKEEAVKRHQELEDQLKNKEDLKNKLERKFKRAYFIIRFVLISFWFVILGILYYFGLINNLSDALNYSELLIILLVVINFLTFGTLSNLEKFIDLIKIKTENWIYGKNIKLNSEIEQLKSEL
jgi:hypothetical protein